MQAVNAIAKVTVVITGKLDIAHILIVERNIAEMVIEMSQMQSLNRRRFSTCGNPPLRQK